MLVRGAIATSWDLDDSQSREELEQVEFNSSAIPKRSSSSETTRLRIWWTICWSVWSSTRTISKGWWKKGRRNISRRRRKSRSCFTSCCPRPSQTSSSQGEPSKQSPTSASRSTSRISSDSRRFQVHPLPCRYGHHTAVPGKISMIPGRHPAQRPLPRLRRRRGQLQGLQSRNHRYFFRRKEIENTEFYRWRLHGSVWSARATWRARLPDCADEFGSASQSQELRHPTQTSGTAQTQDRHAFG